MIAIIRFQVRIQDKLLILKRNLYVVGLLQPKSIIFLASKHCSYDRTIPRHTSYRAHLDCIVSMCMEIEK